MKNKKQEIQALKKVKISDQAGQTKTAISAAYHFIEKSAIITGIVKRGGLRFKMALGISLTLFVIVVMFIFLFTTMSSSALMSANDKLCLTIAGNISATESILTAESKPLKRSLVLQDIVSGLVKSKINGLVYAAVYDLSGKLVERPASFAAHTDGLKRAVKIPEKLFDEIKNIDSFQKKRIIFTDKNNNQISSYQYRLPFKFFNVKVGVIDIVFTEDSILGPIQSAKRIIIIFSCILLVLGMGLAVVIATGMVRPIKNLSAGMIRVREGDLEIKLSVDRHDEIGDMSREFNTMIVHLREKLQMQKFVSESTVSMIRKKTASGKIDLGGTRQNYAYLFSDVRGFTAMSEKMQPEDVVTILNEYLDMQAQIIKKNNGDIDKFVGDEIMAVFTGSNKANDAIACAIEITEELKKLNKKREDAGEKVINIGIGLNLGDVVEGRIGSRDRMDNTSIGDTVNLAARLCSQAEAGMILASKNIVSKASSGKFKGKKLEPIRVKGKEKPIEVYSITGMK